MIYPTGALLLAPDGTAYRVREPFADVQELSVMDVGPTHGVTRADDLPRDVKILWEPSGIAYPVHRAYYADRQEQISSALALVDDLTQDAGDIGDKALMHTLANAYHAIERFRILSGRPMPDRPQA